MEKKPVLLLMMVVSLFSFACKRGEKSASVRTEVIDGIEHIYNTGEPVEGKISLELEEVARIDSSEIDPGEPPLFQMAVKDETGNLYLADSRNIRVYKFDSSGKLVTQFLRNGQGPGEFPRFGDLQVTGNHIWIIGNWPMKIAAFTLNGEYVGEWLFPTFQNFYLRTRVLEEDRFLTVCYQDGTDDRGRIRVSALMNAEEELHTQYYEDENAGIFRIRTAQQEGPAIASTNPLVAADIHHAYDRDTGTVIVCNNNKYEIYLKNSDGSTRIVIHKENKKIDLDEEKKEEVLQLIAPRIPAEAMEEAKRQLPDALNAIWAIDVLPDGHLAVIRITGLESVEIDIFDREGRLAATILPSEEIPDLREVFFFKDTIGVIAESEEKNIFIEYRVKNLKGIYN